MGYYSKTFSSVFIFILSFTFSLGTKVRGEDYFYVDAKINNRNARLILDTACESTILEKGAFEKFGLRSIQETKSKKVPVGKVAVGLTEEADFEMFGTKVRTAFNYILDEHEAVETDADGLLGWQTIRNNCFILDGATRLIQVIEEVPIEVQTWQKFEIDANKSVAAFRLTNGKTVTIDTGKISGAGLAPTTWREWYTREKPEKGTLIAYFMPSVGNVISELYLAKKLDVGELEVNEIPVMKANMSEQAVEAGEDYFGSLGIEALKRMDVVVDGRRRIIYIRPKQSAPKMVNHNRLGAIFVPQSGSENVFKATVLSNTPAYSAGLRTGDILLALDGKPIERVQTVPLATAKLLTKWTEPAGSKHVFSVKRHLPLKGNNSEVKKIPVTLEEILVNHNNSKTSVGEVLWYRELSIACYKSRQPEKAVAFITEAIRIAPERGDLRAIRGIVYETVNKLSEAAEDLEFAIAADPTRTDIILELGQVQLALNNSTRAIELYSTVLERNNDNVKALRGRAQAQYRQKNFNASIKDASAGLLLKPKDTELLIVRGKAYKESGKHDFALKDFDDVVAQEPDNESVSSLRVESLLATRQYVRAVGVLSELTALHPTNINALILQSKIYGGCPDNRVRNGAKARDLALKACRDSDWSAWEALEALAIASAELGNFIDAIKWQKKALEVGVPEKLQEQRKLYLSKFEQKEPIRILDLDTHSVDP